MSDHDDRRYSDEEFALVLRRAVELQTRGDADAPSGAPASRAAGLSLAEMQEIAREAGIDPARIADAAALLPRPDEDALTRILGGSTKLRLERTVPGVLPERASGQIIAAIRRGAEHQGETTEIHGALEWRHSDEVTSLGVNITPLQGETNIQVVVDRTGAAVLTYVLTFIPLMFLTIAVGAGLGLEVAAGLALVLVNLTVWVLSARALNRRGARIRRAQIERVLAAASAAIARHNQQRPADALPGDEPAALPAARATTAAPGSWTSASRARIDFAVAPTPADRDACTASRTPAPAPAARAARAARAA